MSVKFKRILICFFAILFTVIAGAYLPFFSHFLPDVINKVSLTNANADIGGYNLDSGESAYLSGEWEFFWGEHIISDNVKNPKADAIVQVPASWTTYEINGKKLPNGGRASYRAYLENVNSKKPFLVSVPNLSGECEVFINGVCVFSNTSIPGTEYNVAFESYAIP